MTLRTYKEVRKELKNFEVTKKNAIITMIFSFLLATFIVSIPTIVLVNLLIFKDYTKLIAVGFGVLLILLIHLVEYFYELGVTEGKIKGIHIRSIVHSIFVSVIVFIVLMILFITGVI